MSRTLIDAVALSPLQRGLYAVSMTAGEWDPYLVRFALRFEGIGDLDRLHRAWIAMAARHPQLTGQVRTDGLPHPVLLMFSDAEPDWTVTDVRAETDPVAAARRIYRAEGYRRVDLERGPLMRLHAVQVADDVFEVVCTAHHIVVDGWSIPIMVTDLVALYDGSRPLPDPVPLRQHAAWLADRDVAESSNVWRDALAGLDEAPMIGSAANELAGEPVIGEWALTAEQTSVVADWARSAGLTMNTVTQLAWARVISGLTGRDDVVFGQTTSGRDDSLPGVQRIVGGLVTTIPVRVSVDESSPAEAGNRLQRLTAQLRRHEFLGIAEITRAAGIGQLFDTLLVFENAPTDGIIDGIALADGGRLIPHRVESPSHYPVAVIPVLEGDRLIVRVEVRPDMIARFPADRLARRVAQTVRAVCTAERLCDIDILLPDEATTILAADASIDASATDGELPSVEQTLLDAAYRSPDAVAVVDSAGAHTFADFAYLARRMAWGLADLGVRPGDMVAVMLPRTAAVVAAPFAVALAGGTCVHVDPDTPAERLHNILATSGARIVVAADTAHDRIAEAAVGLSGELRSVSVDSLLMAPERRLPSVDIPATRRPLYVVYTSGTTGRPKGVVVTHHNLLEHWRTHDRRIFTPTAGLLGRQLRIGHGWSTGFDAAWQPTIALLSGHAVVLMDDETRVDAQRAVAAIADQGIDVFDTSPSMLTRLVDAGLFGDPASPRDECGLAILALGGEAISPDVWQRLSRLPSTRVINFYGPTETTVEVFMATVADHAAPTLGHPFRTVGAQVLDHRLRPVPPGAQGELYVAGGQTALGYLDRPGLTAAAFVADANGNRRYRTGDVVIRATDDTVSFAGRIDDQVKINGYRVEPADAAAVLRAVPGVRHAEVLAIKERGRTRLGALIVSDRPISDIRADLAGRLPAYLVPTRYALVDSIPLNSNDKVDVRVAAELLRNAVGQAVTPPATATERLVVDLVRELGPETMADGDGAQIGMEHTLADLGIDSIGVMEVASRLRAAGFPLSARQVAGATDLGALARLADSPPAEDDSARNPVAAGTVWPLSAVAQQAALDGAPHNLVQLQALRLPAAVGPDEVSRILAELAAAHPSLRSRLDIDGTAPQLVIGDVEPIEVLTFARGSADVVDELTAHIDPIAGRMMATAVLEPSMERRDRLLLLMIHHLATDAVSWRVVARDLHALASGEAVAVESVPDAPVALPAALLRHGSPLGARFSDPELDGADRAVLRSIDLGVETSTALLQRCDEQKSSVADALLQISAVASAVTVGTDGRVAVAVEGHGRADGDDDRVGWFTVETPMLVDPTGTAGPIAAAAEIAADTRLNYLGRLDRVGESAADWAPLAPDAFAAEFGTAGINPLPLRHSVDILASVVGGPDGVRLIAHISANSAVLAEADIDDYVQRWRNAAQKNSEQHAEVNS